MYNSPRCIDKTTETEVCTYILILLTSFDQFPPLIAIWSGIIFHRIGNRCFDIFQPIHISHNRGSFFMIWLTRFANFPLLGALLSLLCFSHFVNRISINTSVFRNLAESRHLQRLCRCPLKYISNLVTLKYCSSSKLL